jgi:hypothetical protein
MDKAARSSQFLDADAFLRTDQSALGNTWCYELVHGVIVAHAALLGIAVPLAAPYERVPLEEE